MRGFVSSITLACSAFGVLAAVFLAASPAALGAPCGDARYHDADADENYVISLTELLRQIQFFNSGGYSFCPDDGTEDGYCPGPAPNRASFPCEDEAVHDTDQSGNNAIELDELLRLIQFFNTGAFFYCPNRDTEDQFCPGEPVAKVTVTPATRTVGMGGGTYLDASSTDGEDTIRWETSDPGVATVDDTGAVMAAAPGTARIRATGSQSDAWAEAEVTVTSDSLTVEPAVLYLHDGAQATLLPASSAVDDTFGFVSDSSGIASVNGTGEVSANAEGETFITVTSDKTGLTVDVPVSVVPLEELLPGPGRAALAVEEVPGRPYDPALKVTLDDSSEFLLQDPADTQNYNERFSEILPDPEDTGGQNRAARAVTVPTTRPAARYVNHAAFQTGFRNQQDRNTCTLFATIAALEARYKRAGYGDLDLSEQHLNHIGKMTWLHPFTDEARPRGVYENQLGMTSGGGVYVVGHLTRYGVPLESQVPYRHSNQAPYASQDYHNISQAGDNPYVMPGLTRQDLTQREINDFNLEDQFTTWSIPGDYAFTPLSKFALRDGQYGVTTYEKCPPGRIKDIAWWENVLNMGYEISFQANLVWDTVDGVWVARDAMPEEGIGSHAMLMTGYDRRDPAHPYFIVKNQWGETNFIKMDYNWVTESLDGTMTHAIFITGITDPASKRFKQQVALGRWTIETDIYSDPGELDLFKLGQFFPSTDLRGQQDRRLGEFYDVSGNPYKVNGFIYPNFAAWYLDFANPNADFGDLGGNRFFGYFDVDYPELMAGFYIPPSGPHYGFYGHKDGPIDSLSVFTSVTSDEAYLGRWEIIHGRTDGYVEVTSVGNTPGLIGVTYESPEGDRFSYGASGDYTTREVNIGLNNVFVDNKGTFVGYILNTNPGIMAGYFDPASGVRSGMVLRRTGYASTQIVINEPVANASFLVNDTVNVQADTFGDGLVDNSPSIIRWSLDTPSNEGGTVIANGANTSFQVVTPGTHILYAVYLEETLSGPYSYAVDQVTITVRDASAPTVTITEPTDGDHFGMTGDPNPVPVQFMGEANDTGDGAITGSDLKWSYRKQGTSTWTDAGTGDSITINLEDQICFEFTNYEVRLQATDSDSMTGTDVITVGVNTLFCK